MSVRPVPTIAHIVALNVLVFGYHELANMDTPTDNVRTHAKTNHSPIYNVLSKLIENHFWLYAVDTNFARWPLAVSDVTRYAA